MIGTDANSGGLLGGDAHLAQSLADILSTPLGSRVMRRDYGSLLFELLDRPINGGLRLLLHAATALAIRRWEPRIKLTKVALDGEPQAGQLTMRIEGSRTDLPAPNNQVSLTIPITPRTSATTSAGAIALPSN